MVQTTKYECETKANFCFFEKYVKCFVNIQNFLLKIAFKLSMDRICKRLEINKQKILEWLCIQMGLKVFFELFVLFYFECGLCKIEDAEFPSMDPFTNPAKICYFRHGSFKKNTYLFYPCSFLLSRLTCGFCYVLSLQHFLVRLQRFLIPISLVEISWTDLWDKRPPLGFRAARWLPGCSKGLRAVMVIHFFYLTCLWKC